MNRRGRRIGLRAARCSGAQACADTQGMDRSTAGRLGAYESWARTPNRSARNAPARQGFEAKFDREARERLGPDATDKQVADAADAGRKAYYVRLSAASVAARQARRSS